MRIIYYTLISISTLLISSSAYSGPLLDQMVKDIGWNRVQNNICNKTIVNKIIVDDYIVVTYVAQAKYDYAIICKNISGGSNFGNLDTTSRKYCVLDRRDIVENEYVATQEDIEHCLNSVGHEELDTLHSNIGFIPNNRCEAYGQKVWDELASTGFKTWKENSCHNLAIPLEKIHDIIKTQELGHE